MDSVTIATLMAWDGQRKAPPPGFPKLPDVPAARYTSAEFYALEQEHITMAPDWDGGDAPDLWTVPDATSAPIRRRYRLGNHQAIRGGFPQTQRNKPLKERRDHRPIQLRLRGLPNIAHHTDQLERPIGEMCDGPIRDADRKCIDSGLHKPGAGPGGRR